MSQKYSLYADRAEHLQERGMGRRSALLAVATQATIPIEGEWLEAFWCDECQATEWYHVRKHDRGYELSIAPRELWEQAIGVILPNGNPSVGEFTRRHARRDKYHGIKDFNALN